ncbi:MAG TPA: hypothetical protein VGN18_11625 [Jatrophihabitans sp.]|jgi:hypothetical protein|uniref:hypothetical protein n=1 Tax=Jatrophihabitans sp. TaxID=1932789 RepID=UPI002E0237D3|nr:hypothetical protein [Jatrophihabitans sp.]
MAFLAILEVTLLLASIAIVASRPRHRMVRPQLPEPTPTAVAVDGTPTPIELPAVLRMRRVGRSQMTEETPTTARIAPLGCDAALQVLWVGETVLADLDPADLVTVRAWSQGRLAYAIGETRRDYGSWIPQDAAVAGWEIYLVTASGRIMHLLGEPGTDIDRELARLDDRVRVALVADAA